MYKKKQKAKRMSTEMENLQQPVELTVNRNEMETGIFRIRPLCVFASGKALNVDVQVVSERSSLLLPSFRSGWLLMVRDAMRVLHY